MFILPKGAPKRWAIFEAKCCDPVPEKIFTEGFISSMLGAKINFYNFKQYFILKNHKKSKQ
jgi:hypothetical protein